MNELMNFCFDFFKLSRIQNSGPFTMKTIGRLHRWIKKNWGWFYGFTSPLPLSKPEIKNANKFNKCSG